jgi:hypothetical protein
MMLDLLGVHCASVFMLESRTDTELRPQQLGLEDCTMTEWQGCNVGLNESDYRREFISSATCQGSAHEHTILWATLTLRSVLAA